MTSLIFSLFTKMAFSEEDKYVIKFFRQNKYYRAKRFLKKSFLIKAGLVVDWIRLFARLILLELRNVFPALAVRARLELLTKLKKFKGAVHKKTLGLSHTLTPRRCES